jgi:hypothetical protein
MHQKLTRLGTFNFAMWIKNGIVECIMWDNL